MAIEDYYRPLNAYTVAQGVDEFGDTTSTLQEAGTFLGHIGKPNSSVALRMAQQGIDVKGRLYAPLSAPVGEFSVIVEPDTGAAFQVASEPRDAARRGHHIEADLVEWRGGVSVADSEQ